jgi:hypothetical protein
VRGVGGGIILWLVGSVFVFPVFAATNVSIVQMPASVDERGQVEVDVVLTCTGCSDSYLRGVLYPEGTKYFGFTQNRSGVFTNVAASKCTEYFKITSTDLVEGTWSGRLVMQPDRESSFYVGPGEYFLKVGRYTGSCSSPTWSAEMTLAITGPTPTPTLTPTQTPAPTVTPTFTPTISSTPLILSRAPVPSATRFLSPTPQLDERDEIFEEVSSLSAVLGLSSLPSSSSSEKRDREAHYPWRSFAIAFACISLGCALLTGVLVWIKRAEGLRQDDILKE